jgi:thiamine pyrophosphokinase
MNFPLDKLDFISGDFDSHSGSDENIYEEKFIYTPDQDKTDFHKALEIIEKDKKVDVLEEVEENRIIFWEIYGCFAFKDQLDIKFYDEFSEYYFIPKQFAVKG